MQALCKQPPQMSVELVNIFSLLLGEGYSDKVALFGELLRRSLFQPRVLARCRWDSYSVALRFWLVGSVGDTSVVEFHFLYVAKVEMHGSETLIGWKFSFYRLASPGQGEHVFEADDGIFILFYLGEAVAHLLVCVHFADYIVMSMSTIPQLAIHFDC